MGDLAAAIAIWDAYNRGARAHEKAFARQKASELAVAMPPELALRTYLLSPEKGLGRAMLGAKAAGHLRAQGDVSGASTIEGETSEARRALGLDDLAKGAAPGDPTRVGLAVPLSGRLQPVGEAAMRAAMLAAGCPGGGRRRRTHIQLAVRDTAEGGERAALGLGELAREEGVIGVVCSAERKAAAAALAQAAGGRSAARARRRRAGSGDDGLPARSRAEARVAELRGARSSWARETSRSWGPTACPASACATPSAARSPPAAGASRRRRPVAGATSFQAGSPRSRRRRPRRCSWATGRTASSSSRRPSPSPISGPRPGASAPRGRNRASPGAQRAPAVDGERAFARLLQNAGRYVQGALLAPASMATLGDAAARAFVDAYDAAYGQEPDADRGRRVRRRGRAPSRDGAGRGRAPTCSRPRGRDVRGAHGRRRFGPDHGRVVRRASTSSRAKKSGSRNSAVSLPHDSSYLAAASRPFRAAPKPVFSRALLAARSFFRREG